jgi:hypothetical protein
MRRSKRLNSSKWNSIPLQLHSAHSHKEQGSYTSRFTSHCNGRFADSDRYLAKATHSYYSVSPFLSDPSNFPQNDSLKQIAAGLAEGWKAYGRDDAAILFVVQEGERNVFDQKWLEYELLES